MTTKASLTIKGLDEYLAVIVQVGKDVDAAAEKAVIAGGDVLLVGMDERVPVLTGDLKAHLRRTKPVRSGNVVSVDIGVFDGENLPEAALARKANAQEYGYERGGKHFPAQSYVRAAIDGDSKAAVQAEKDSLTEDGLM